MFATVAAHIVSMYLAISVAQTGGAILPAGNPDTGVASTTEKVYVNRITPAWAYANYHTTFEEEFERALADN